MTDQEIFALVKQAFVYAQPEKKSQIDLMTQESTFDELGIDSIAALEMSAYLEDKLGSQFPDDELTRVMDMRGFMNLIRRHA